MKPSNLLFILSDEHQRDIAGCYGDRIAITPNIDRLAARGTRFTNAYTPCPICVPARAALATGRWVHQVKAWDMAQTTRLIELNIGRDLQYIRFNGMIIGGLAGLLLHIGERAIFGG